MKHAGVTNNKYYTNGIRNLEVHGNRTADYKAMTDPSTRKLVAKIRSYQRKELIWFTMAIIKFSMLVGLFILYLRK